MLDKCSASELYSEAINSAFISCSENPKAFLYGGARRFGSQGACLGVPGSKGQVWDVPSAFLFKMKTAIH